MTTAPLVPAQRAERDPIVIDGRVVPRAPAVIRVVGPEPIRWRRVSAFVVPAFVVAFIAGVVVTVTGVTSAAFHLIASVVGVGLSLAFLGYAVERVSHRRPGHSCPRCAHH